MPPLHRQLAALLVCAATFPAQSLAAETYLEIALLVQQTNFSSTVLISSNGTSTFAPGDRSVSWTARCVIGSNNWIIENDFSPNATTTYYFDGTNVLGAQ